MKKLALKGLAVLAGVVLLCLFFSGTLHGIMTAKVRLVSPRMGMMETELTMTGSLYWPRPMNLYPALGEQDSLTVLEVLARKGARVRAGELLMRCEVTDFESRMDTLKGEYDTKTGALIDLERKHSGKFNDPQQERWISEYQAVLDTADRVLQARIALRTAAGAAGAELEGDALPAGASDAALLEAEEELRQARTAETAAREAFDRTNRIGMSEEMVTYLTQKAELNRDLEKLTGSMADLSLLAEKGTDITAPYDGYVIACEITAGGTLTRGTAAVQLSAENTLPVLRLETGGAHRVIPAGTPAELSAGERTAQAEVASQGVAEDGAPCVDINLTPEIISALGGINALSDSGSVTARIRLRSEGQNTLLPTAAVRGSEGDYYVYTVVANVDALGAEKMTIEKKEITVIGQSGSVTAVEEGLMNDRIAYMEDRPLTEGCEVMQYEAKK